MVENKKADKEILKDLCGNLNTILDQAKSFPGMNESIARWKRTTNEIIRQLDEEVIRGAVTGAVKSGKSTFVNSLLGNDFLKRGAGIVTSFVTRIRKGKQPGAKLFLKSIPMINREIEKSIQALPSLENDFEAFDIQDESRRKELYQSLQKIQTESLIEGDARNSNAVLLFSCLNGYDRVKDFLSEKEEIIEFDKDQFYRHMLFTGNDDYSVYLNDILLTIDSPHIGNGVEIADCQGSDSPNPMHLAMIQDYLFQTNLMIYVIGSRTGLRRADIKFLSIARQMGVLGDALFVVNVDFDEHENREDLKTLVDKIREEIRLLGNEPEIFAFSALYNLFCSEQFQLSEKERMRRDLWKKYPGLTGYSDSETERFIGVFHQKLTEQRNLIFMKSHTGRLQTVINGLKQSLFVTRQVMEKDNESAFQFIEVLKNRQSKIKHVESVITNTLRGFVQNMKQETKKETDRFFDEKYGQIVPDVIDFIKGYHIPEHIKQSSPSKKFSESLREIYDDFKNKLDGHLSETVNPKIIRFVKEEEKRIEEKLETTSRPFIAMVNEAISEYMDSELPGFPGTEISVDPLAMSVKLKAVKEKEGIGYPAATTTLDYSVKIQTETTLRFGFYKFGGFIKRLFKKGEQAGRQEKQRALKDAVKRFKKKATESVTFHLKDYRENLKHQYLLTLIDSASNRLYEILTENFEATGADLVKIREHLGENREEQNQTRNFARILSENVDDLKKELDALFAEMVSPAGR